MKINYDQSKIYKISDKNGYYYIDTTTDTYLSKRLLFLRKTYEMYLIDNTRKYEPYFKIFESGQFVTSLVENFNCETKKELKERLKEIVNLDENKTDFCLNHNKVKTRRVITKIRCDVCNIEIASNQKTRHERGKFHNRFLSIIQPNVEETEHEFVVEN